jgi:hypothetical protein
MTGILKVIRSRYNLEIDSAKQILFPLYCQYKDKLFYYICCIWKHHY